MIQIYYFRSGLTVVAVTVNDDRSITTARGFTRDHARWRLIEKLSYL